MVVPTYNEIENLQRLITRIRSTVPTAHILVVDDASPDGTGKLADQLADADPRLHVMHRLSKDGLGAAYAAGFRWALDHGYDIVVQMDADGSHRPEELPHLLSALGSADAVIGSRWVPGGQVVNWPWHRKALSIGGNAYTRLALHMPIRDATGGYRAFRRRVLESIQRQ